MGAPTSSIFSEIFLQYLENNRIYDILVESNIIVYFRYVDDILVVYNEDITNIHNILDQFNKISSGLIFTLELEHNKQINFLDLTLTRLPQKIHVNIYRKPTTTDVLIPQDSCHPQEHKMAAAKYFVNRVSTYIIDITDKQKELKTVKQILQNNKYNASSVINTLKKEKRNHPKSMQETQNKKWSKFTYTGKETRTITNLFKKIQDSPQYL
jgi:hypothetical protein